MRCIFGLVLCVVLCYGGIQALYAVATASAAANNPGISQRDAQAAGWEVVHKYHAHVYVVAGLITIAVCSLPTLLAKHTGFNEEEEWHRVAKAERS
jgi:hypothetical protein